MTSRLKRKLENIGVDVQSNSSRLTENFCLIGTPLPPLEKAKDSGEFIPLWKQEVRDEKGRRRLHGAFTGGFSAGYYNTVGSKEGWTPSTFTSSRGDRASSRQAKPEDFMDEEDLAELRESKKLVDMTEETDIFSGTRAELSRGGGGADKDSITSALESLIPPSKDSVGARLLKKMGWRPGQGIGPRVTYKQLRAQDGIPIGKDEAIDEEASKHLYAPRDTKVVAYHMNENAFGLGYTPGQGLTEIVRNGNNAETGPKLSVGFGLGALNDAEDDDLDVYDQGLMRENRRMAYDTREMEEDERVFSHAKDSSVTKKKANTPSATSRDGKPIVSGFVLVEKPLIESRWFPMSDVPTGWQPDPRRVWAKDISNGQDRTSDSHHAAKPLDHRSWLKGKTAHERGSMLGEVPLPSAPRSVFDYLSEKDRERLKNLAAGLTSHPPPLKQTQPPSKMDIPHIDPRTAQAALTGFQPFTTNLEKQQRYTVYLQSQAAPSESERLKPLPGQSNEDFIKEISEYIKSAQIFKPVSGAMAGRFASASTMEMLGSTNQGLHKPTKEEYARLDEPKPEEEKKDIEEESPKANAARMGMFGPLTRETKVWQPARLLCKRFGVKDPHPDGATSAMAEDTGGKPQAWTAELVTPQSVPENNMSPDAAVKNSAGSSAPPASSSGSMGRRDISNIGMGEDEEQGKDTLTYERPTKDIFKAIFASDEEDSDDEPDEDVPSSIPPPAPPAVPKATSPNNRLQEASSGEKVVDLANFRPTFVPKSERGDRKKVAEKSEPKKKDRDKKKKGKVVVSFDLEDEGGPRNSEQRKEKRRKKEKVDEADSESIWVEKPPPEITKNLVIPVVTEPDESDQHRPHRGRKRAVDFL